MMGLPTEPYVVVHLISVRIHEQFLRVAKVLNEQLTVAFENMTAALVKARDLLNDAQDKA